MVSFYLAPSTLGRFTLRILGRFWFEFDEYFELTFGSAFPDFWKIGLDFKYAKAGHTLLLHRFSFAFCLDSKIKVINN